MSNSHVRQTVETIRDRMLARERFSSTEVVSWMASGEIELQGAAYQAVTAAPSVIDGTIETDAINAFLADYFIRCMESDGREPATIFALLPFLAANCLANWYRALRRDARVPSTHPVLVRTRDALRRIYLEGGANEQSRVVHGALEHIFESLSVRADFQDWSRDERLANAFREAEAWGDAHLAR
jgi:hypothetical protein